MSTPSSQPPPSGVLLPQNLYPHVGDEMFTGLGSFWTDIHQGKDVTRTLATALQDLVRQAEVNTKEGLLTADASNAPTYHTQFWYRYSIVKGSELPSEGFIARYGEGRVYDDGLLYGESQQLWVYRLPPSLVGVGSVSDRITDPGVVWYETAGFLVDYEAGLIGFRSDPFLQEGMVTENTPAGTVGHLWFYLSLWDTGLLQSRYALALQARSKTTKSYRNLVEGLWSNRIRGTSRDAFYDVITGITGVPFARGDETVEGIYTHQNRLIIVTDAQVYTCSDQATALVQVGDELYRHGPLFDAFNILDRKTFDQHDIWLGPEYFAPGIGLKGAIGFPNREVAVVDGGLDAQGRRVATFELDGDFQDIQRYRNFLHESEFCRYLDLRGPDQGTPPGSADLMPTVNPATYIVGERVLPNLVVASVRRDLWDTPPDTHRLLTRVAREILPPRSALLLVEKVLDEDESYSSESMSSSSLSTIDSTDSSLQSPSSESSESSTSSLSTVSQSSLSTDSDSSSSDTDSSQTPSSDTSSTESSLSTLSTQTLSSRSTESLSSESSSSRSSLSSATSSSLSTSSSQSPSSVSTESSSLSDQSTDSSVSTSSTAYLNESSQSSDSSSSSTVAMSTASTDSSDSSASTVSDPSSQSIEAPFSALMGNADDLDNFRGLPTLESNVVALDADGATAPSMLGTWHAISWVAGGVWNTAKTSVAGVSGNKVLLDTASWPSQAPDDGRIYYCDFNKGIPNTSPPQQHAQSVAWGKVPWLVADSQTGDLVDSLAGLHDSLLFPETGSIEEGGFAADPVTGYLYFFTETINFYSLVAFNPATQSLVWSRTFDNYESESNYSLLVKGTTLFVQYAGDSLSAPQTGDTVTLVVGVSTTTGADVFSLFELDTDTSYTTGFTTPRLDLFHDTHRDLVVSCLYGPVATDYKAYWIDDSGNVSTAVTFNNAENDDGDLIIMGQDSEGAIIFTGDFDSVTTPAGTWATTSVARITGPSSLPATGFANDSSLTLNVTAGSGDYAQTDFRTLVPASDELIVIAPGSATGVMGTAVNQGQAFSVDVTTGTVVALASHALARDWPVSYHGFATVGYAPAALSSVSESSVTEPDISSSTSTQSSLSTQSDDPDWEALIDTTPPGSADPWTQDFVDFNTAPNSWASGTGLGESEISAVEIPFTRFSGDDLVFWAKRSGTDGQAYLHVDGVEVMADSDFATSWTQYNVPVSAGSHTLRFSVGTDSGSTSVSQLRIDDIELPVTEQTSSSSSKSLSSNSLSSDIISDLSYGGPISIGSNLDFESAFTAGDWNDSAFPLTRAAGTAQNGSYALYHDAGFPAKSVYQDLYVAGYDFVRSGQGRIEISGYARKEGVDPRFTVSIRPYDKQGSALKGLVSQEVSPSSTGAYEAFTAFFDDIPAATHTLRVYLEINDGGGASVARFDNLSISLLPPDDEYSSASMSSSATQIFVGTNMGFESAVGYGNWVGASVYAPIVTSGQAHSGSQSWTPTPTALLDSIRQRVWVGGYSDLIDTDNMRFSLKAWHRASSSGSLGVFAVRFLDEQGAELADAGAVTVDEPGSVDTWEQVSPHTDLVVPYLTRFIEIEIRGKYATYNVESYWVDDVDAILLPLDHQVSDFADGLEQSSLSDSSGSPSSITDPISDVSSDSSPLSQSESSGSTLSSTSI